MSDHRAVRRRQLIDHARSHGLDGVLVHCRHRQTVGWLTGYSPGYVTNAATLWLGADGRQQIGVRFPFDVVRARQLSGMEAVWAASPFDVLPKTAKRIGLVAGDSAVDETTGALLIALQSAGIEHTDLCNVVDDLQEAKLPGEVAALRYAGDVAAAALELWGPSAPDGRTDYEVAAAIEAACRARGARRAICLVGVGTGAVVSECVGATIGPGDAVGLELTIYVDEWCMHVNTQLASSNPNPDNDEAQATCALTRAAMRAAMRPGVAIDDVVAVGDAVLAEAGLLEAKEYDFGHGLAADTPAHPRLVSGTGRTLQLNAVAALHVAVRVPDGPTGFVGGPVCVTSDGGVELNPTAMWARLTDAVPKAVDSPTNHYPDGLR